MASAPPTDPAPSPSAQAGEKAVVLGAAQKYGINPSVLWGVYGTESGYGKNTGPSSAGAVGPFQFEPSTAKSLGVNPLDFKSAATGAADYLSQFKGRGTAGCCPRTTLGLPADFSP